MSVVMGPMSIPAAHTCSMNVLGLHCKIVNMVRIPVSVLERCVQPKSNLWVHNVPVSITGSAVSP